MLQSQVMLQPQVMLQVMLAPQHFSLVCRGKGKWGLRPLTSSIEPRPGAVHAGLGPRLPR